MSLMTVSRSLSLTFHLSADHVVDFSALALAGGRGRGQPIIDVFFDTADQDLREAGLCLSVRRMDGRSVQRARHWPGERPNPDWPDHFVKKPAPDVDALPPTFARHLDKAEKHGGLATVCEVTVERRERVSTHGRASVVAALDCGTIRAGDARIELREARLRLSTGRPADLFACAREFGKIIPMRLEFASRAERGFLARDGGWGSPVKKASLDISPDMNAAEGFATIARGCLRQFSLNMPAFAAGQEIEATHQTRVAIRRLRAAMSLFAPILRDDARDHIRSGLKWLFGEMGAARELDALRDLCLASNALEAIAVLEPRRLAAHAALSRALASRRLDRLLLDVAEWIEAGAWRRAREPDQARNRGLPIGVFAARRLTKRRRSFRSAVALFDALDPEGLHELRIEAKKLRYGSEFLAPLAREGKMRERRDKTISALSALQDTLGLLHDMDVNEGGLGPAFSITPATPAKGDAPPSREELHAKGRREAAHAAAMKPFWSEFAIIEEADRPR